MKNVRHDLMTCRPGCGACCIAPSISCPLPGMPQGKPAGVRCPELSPDGRCLVHEGMDGVRRYTTELLKQFDRLGYRYDLAKPGVRGRWLEQLWEHCVLPLKARKHDVLFCPANVAPVWVPRQVRLVVTVHSLSFLKVPEIYGRAFRAYYTWLMPRVVRRADAVLTVSKAEAAVIEEAYPFARGKVTAIPLGVAEEFRPGDPAEKRDEILFVGNLGPGKGLRTLLEAFALIADRVPHRLVVVGASFRAFKAAGDLAERLAPEVRERIDWVGQVNDPEELAGYYRRAAVFVFPSLYESFGLPVAEAMACGTAVVVSDLPALRETVGEAGVFVRGGDAGALREALERVLGSGEMMADLCARGAARVRGFGWGEAAVGAWRVMGGE